MRTTTFALSFPLVALAAACGPAPEPASPTAAPTATPVVDVAPPPGLAPAPSASASAAAAAPSAPASPFAVVATLPSAITIVGVEGALVVAGESVGTPEEAAAWIGKANAKPDKEGNLSGLPIGVLTGGKLRFPRALLLDGMAGMRAFAGAAGRWPGELYVLSTGTDGRTGIAEPWLASEEHGYKAKRGGDSGHYFVGAARAGGGAYGVEAPTIPFPGSKPALVDLATGRPALSFQPASKKDCWDAESKQLLQTAAVMPFGVGSTAEGDLITVGHACNDGVGVEVWKKGAKGSTVATLPPSVVTWDEHPTIVPAKDKGAWIVPGAALLRWDGATLTRVELPAGTTLGGAAALGPDGALYLAAGPGALLRSNGAGWEKVALPVKDAVDGLAVAEGQLYAAAGKALLRLGAKDGDAPVFTPEASPVPAGAPASGPPAISRTMSPPPLGAPQEAAAATPSPKRKLPGPGSSKCAHNVVLLYAFTKLTPDDYDFPLTRKAVKGHTELSGVKFSVVKENGKKFFSGLAPSYEAAKKLQALIAREVKDSSPQIFCAEPEVVREIAIDLRTGEVAKK
jgi:hypothetical protein